MDFEFGQSEKSEAFFNRHSDFWASFNLLMEASNKCFGRVCNYKNRAEEVCFSLGQTCRKDYLEITFLAVHGFEIGARKLLRGLYERAVTHAYIIQNPEKAIPFCGFAAIQDYKVMKGALESGVTEREFNAKMSPDSSVEKITERRNEVKDEFQATECLICGMETPVSWDKASIGAMAKKAGELYKALYLGSYAMANPHVHATLTSALYLEDKDETIQREIRETEAYANIGQASAIMLLVLKEQNRLFDLHLDQELEDVEKAIVEAWFLQ